MKGIYLIIPCLLTLLIINNCENSLGYDPNVVVHKIEEKIGKDTSENEPVNTRFKVDSVFFSFYEIYPDAFNKTKKLKWFYRTLHKEIYCDTTEEMTHIKLNLKFENKDMTDQFYVYNKVVDRILDFELFFSTQLNPVYFFYPLDDTTPNSKWIKLTAKNLHLQRDYEFTGASATSHIFLYEENYEKGFIRLSFSVELFNIFKYHNRKFIGYITLFFD